MARTKQTARVVTVTNPLNYSNPLNEDIHEVEQVPAMSRTTNRMRELGIDPSMVEVDPALLNWKPSMTIDEYLEKYKSSSTPEELETLRVAAVAEENKYRELYAKKAALPDHEYLKNKDLFMIPVYGNEECFKSQNPNPNEDSSKILFPLEKRRKAGDSAISSQSDFQRNWRIFSERLLDIVNWDNVFVAGGSILACLLPVPTGADKNFKTLRKYYHEDVYSGSDIDLFIYGLNEEQGKEKLKEIYEAVCNEIPYNVIAFRSAYAISIVSQFPYRHIQIILRLYSSPAEILMGFDVDSCAVGYDGKQVYMMPRCHQALVRQRNTIDMTRRSPTYELRLSKYADRGFDIEVPTLQRDKIDPMIFEKPWENVQGLSKLLILEKLRTPAARYAYKERTMSKRMRLSWKQQRLYNDPYIQKRLEFSSDKASDYSTVFLPWGPDWNAKKIRKMMMTKDIVLNADWSEMFEERGYHTHPCFCGTLEQVIEDCCGNCPPIPDVDSHGNPIDKESLECFVHGPLSFIVDDPGRQSIGSFHPITAGEWEDGAYISEHSDKISIAANSGDVTLLKKYIEEEGVQIDTPDYLGRTPLQIAVISNQLEAVKYLLEKGANINATYSNGRNMIHIACQYGYLDILDTLLTYNKEKKEKEEENIDLNQVAKGSFMNPLHYCVLYGHVDCLKRLLEEGDDHVDATQMVWDESHQNGVPVLAIAGHVEVYDIDAAIEIAKILMQHGAKCPESKMVINDLNTSTQSPFLVALNNGNYAMCDVLLDYKARYDIIGQDLDNLEDLKKKLGIQSWGRNSIDQMTPTAFTLLYNINEKTIKLFKRIVSLGYPINRVYNNSTVLDIVLQKEPYKTKEETKEDLMKNMQQYKDIIEWIKKKMETIDKKSWEYAIYIYTLNNNYNQYNNYVTSSKYSEESKKQLQDLVVYIKELKGEARSTADAESKMRKTGRKSRQSKTASSIGGFGSSFGGFGTAFGGVSGGSFGTTFGCVSNSGFGTTTTTDPSSMLDESIKKDYYYPNGNIGPLVQFTLMGDKQYSYRQWTPISPNDALKYLELFNACWTNNINKVKELCTPKNGKCLLLTVRDTVNRTPISIAFQFSYFELATVILDLMLAQYTPIPVVTNKNTTGLGRRNCVSNFKLLERLNMASPVDDKEEESYVDPNGDADDIINTTSFVGIFDDMNCFPLSILPPKFNSSETDYTYYAHGNYQCGYSRQMLRVSTGGRAPRKHRKGECDGTQSDTELLFEPYENDKQETVSLYPLWVLPFVFNTEQFELLIKKMIENSKLVLEKEIKANIKKEEDRNKIDNYWVYQSTRNNDSKLYIYRNNGCCEFLLKVIIMNDDVEKMKILIKYLFGGMEFVQESKEDETGVSPSVDESAKEEKEEDEMEEEEKEEEEEEEEEEDEEYKYQDSDEEEMEQLNEFRNKKKQQETIFNSLAPIRICAYYNAIKCYKYIQSRGILTEIDSFIANQDLPYHEALTKYSSELLFKGTYYYSPSVKHYDDLLATALNGNALDLFKIILKDAETDNIPKQSIYEGEKKIPSLLEVACSIGTKPIVSYIYPLYTWSDDILRRSIEKLYYSVEQHIETIDSFFYLLDIMLDKKQYSLCTPIFSVCMNRGKYEMVDYLLSHGTPLPTYKELSLSDHIMHYLVSQNYKKLAEIVINRPEIKGDINCENGHGLTPYDIICNMIERNITNANIQNGYNITDMNNNNVNNSGFGFGQTTCVNSNIDNNEEDEEEMTEEQKHIKGLKRKFNQQDSCKEMETLLYVSKKIKGMPRQLADYEEVKSRCNDDAKQASSETVGFSRGYRTLGGFNMNTNTVEYPSMSGLHAVWRLGQIINNNY
ncbi:hypothetical protein WA158_006640 [Blastocystis sp. Blastoise]